MCRISDVLENDGWNDVPKRKCQNDQKKTGREKKEEKKRRQKDKFWIFISHAKHAKQPNKPERKN